MDTLVAWVRQAPAGYFANELEALLHVPVKDPLRTPVERGRLSRHALDERWLYCVPDRARHREQRRARQLQIETFPLAQLSGVTVTQTAELKAAVVLFYSLLDEQQRRQFAGLESFKCGHGGDTLLAGLLSLDADTVDAAGGNCSPGKCNKSAFGWLPQNRVPASRGGPRSQMDTEADTDQLHVAHNILIINILFSYTPLAAAAEHCAA